MKGARLLAQAYYLNENNDYKELAHQAVNFVVSHQKEDGSWGYSLANSGDWTDNYHTGYVLDCLDEYQKLTNDMQYAVHLKKGYDYYVEHFFDENGFPFFYSDKKYPLDCTAASQALLTNIRFQNLPLANKVAQFTIQKMQKKNGSFKFRKFEYYTINTSFIRWSDAWMFAGLSNLIKEL